MKLVRYELQSLLVKLDRPIGDSQVCYRNLEVQILKLFTDCGLMGLGFQEGCARSSAEYSTPFDAQWLLLEGSHPAGHLNKIARPRGGNQQSTGFSAMVDIALWDLVSHEVGLPLWRYLGGEDPRVPAYASTLEFHLPDEDAIDLIGEFQAKGFENFKFKIGHRNLNWDIHRLKLLSGALRPGAYFGVDANEAWCPADAVHALHRYREEGITPAWLEDPCLRDDYRGLACLNAQSPVPIVTGEYLTVDGKRRLLEQHAAGYLNIGGSISAARQGAQLGAAFGIPVHVGHSLFDINMNLAAALPEVKYAEFSDLAWNRLLEAPYRYDNGCIILHDTPGHGLRLKPLD